MATIQEKQSLYGLLYGEQLSTAEEKKRYEELKKKQEEEAAALKRRERGLQGGGRIGLIFKGNQQGVA